MILRCLTDGMSVRATCRATGVSMGTVLRLLEEAGTFCAFYHCQVARNLSTTRAEADEQWSYVGAKQKRAKLPTQGDLWTFAAIDADSKLVITYLVGARTPENTYAFIADLAKRVSNRIQLSTDAFKPYWGAVRAGFDFARCDFATIEKEYRAQASNWYSPPLCVGARKTRKIGRPDMSKVSTSYVENLNLSTRTHCKRFARLTIAHSKKQENHAHAVALHFFTHNFVRVHSTLTKQAGRKTTPAMAAGLTTEPWTMEKLVEMMDPRTVTIK
jgi:IS1 family transposase